MQKKFKQVLLGANKSTNWNYIFNGKLKYGELITNYQRKLISKNTSEKNNDP